MFGAIPLRCVQLLMSSHVGSRPVYLVRSGHCNDVYDMNRTVIKSKQGQRERISADESESCTDLTSCASGPAGYKTDTTTVVLTTTTQSEHRTDNDFEDAESIVGASVAPVAPKIPAALTCNASLSEKGRRFGLRLHKFMCDQNLTAHGGVPAVPFASTTSRAVETASFLPHPPALHQQWSALNILDTGVCHGLSVKKIREEMSAEFELWKKNPFLYRFPGGESTLDMNRRLGDVVLEIERIQEPAVVISHLSTIQSLIAYFTCLDVNKIPFVSVPQHSVIVLTPNIYGMYTAFTDM